LKSSRYFWLCLEGSDDDVVLDWSFFLEELKSLKDFQLLEIFINPYYYYGELRRRETFGMGPQVLESLARSHRNLKRLSLNGIHVAWGKVSGDFALKRKDEDDKELSLKKKFRWSPSWVCYKDSRT